jgi:hypothetical protein
MFASSYNRSNRASRYTQPRGSRYFGNQPRTRTELPSKVFTDDASTLGDDSAPIASPNRALHSSHNAAVRVSIRAGHQGLDHEDTVPIYERGGITAKTVITQLVVEEEGWESSSPSCSNKSF